jgi:hypothetical protein
VFDHVVDVRLEGVQVVVCERLEIVVFVGGELGAARVQLGESPSQFGDPRRARLFGHRAVFEGAEVAVERLVDLA